MNIIVKFLKDIESDYPIIDHINNLDVNFSKVNISSDEKINLFSYMQRSYGEILRLGK